MYCVATKSSSFTHTCIDAYVICNTCMCMCMCMHNTCILQGAKQHRLHAEGTKPELKEPERPSINKSKHIESIPRYSRYFLPDISDILSWHNCALQSVSDLMQRCFDFFHSLPHFDVTLAGAAGNRRLPVFSFLFKENLILNFN